MARCNWLWVLAFLGLQASAADQAESEHLNVRLVAEANAVPGTQLWVGVLLEHAPHWHTYWANPGDSGLPTKLSWRLPPGVGAGEIAWPHPQRFELSGLYNFGFENRQLLPVPIDVPASWSAPSLPLGVKIDWLVCKEECIPGTAELILDVPVRATATPQSEWSADFAAARQRWPTATTAAANVQIDDRLVTIDAELPADFDSGAPFDLFPLQAEVLSNTPASKAETGNGVLRWEVARSDFFTSAPTTMSLVVTQGAPPNSRAWLMEATVTAPGATSPAAVSVPAPEAPLGLGWALLFALVGGAILNLMPCVFPVLALKALSLQGGAHPRHGVVYTLGVVLSFVALAGALLGLRAAGDAIGWGFQLQTPWVVGLLAYLFFAMGLSLSGVFTVGERWMGIGQSLTDGDSDRAAFFTGVLAAVVASPCTAPLMAPALGFALTQSTPVALTVFATLGLGLALPYLLLTLSPALARRLPKPGAWMDRVKQFLAFPLYLSAVWLMWVFGEQQGALAMALVAAGAVMLAMSLWLFGLPSKGRATVAVALLSLAAGGYALTRATSLPAVGATPTADSVAYSEDTLSKLLDSGKPVLVNMTAAWCITCLANERVALSTDAVRDDMRARGVTYVKGDWTRRDEAITRYLAQFQRTGVPLYVLYPGGDQPPQVLPQLLTPDLVLDALASVEPQRRN